MQSHLSSSLSRARSSELPAASLYRRTLAKGSSKNCVSAPPAPLRSGEEGRWQKLLLLEGLSGAVATASSVTSRCHLSEGGLKGAFERLSKYRHRGLCAGFVFPSWVVGA